MTSTPRFVSAGDTALTIEFGDRADWAHSARVLALDARLAAACLPGIAELVPTLRSLTVHYHPGETDAASLAAAIAPLCVDLDAPGPHAAAVPHRWRLPVAYGGAHGPDLDAVAARAGLAPAAAAALHASVDYAVYMIGFLPGHPYLGDVPPPMRLPRRDTPRIAVPAGSVAIATTMTVIYPWESPGGWHILGRTPAPLFDARRSPPSLLAPGDLVRFEPITADEHAALAARATAGEWRPTPELATP